ncbi:sodium/solute symporter [Virgibacillus dakarensis]|uniref:sodium:solute symporter family protein n=1 Tax=Virgibacillus dakarensis TaxID=1917889 RepID=UPI000B445ECB|nr:sodium:solute symporter family protein [Virgibacillus dakarensis]MTW84402.1 sodium/solute symporter [Virgibacillus dakarensis]
MSVENWIVLATMGAYLLFMLWIGRRTSHSVSDLDSYILAGRNLSWPMLAMTYLATVASTVQLLGQPGLAYENGFSLYFWEKVVVITVIILFVVPLARRLRGLKVSTLADIALARFPDSNRIHYILTITQIIWGIFVAALSVFGGSLLVTTVTGIPLPVSLVIIVGVTLGYTILGGLSAVVVTDAAQWGIIIIGSAIFLPLLYLAVDPFTTFFAQYLGADGFSLTQAASNTNIEPGFTDIYTLPVAPLTAIAFLITSGGLPAVDPSYAQRLLSARSEREGRKGLYVFAGVYLLLMTLILTVGMYGAGLRPTLENPDQILLVMAQDYLPLFGKALFLTAVAAAAMSTVSSYLNVTAGLIVKNLILELVPGLSQKRQIFWARISTVIVAVVTLSFAPIATTGLAVAAVAAQIILIAAMGPLIYLILFWRRLTERAAFWGTLITAVATFMLVIVVGGPDAAVLGPGLFGLPVLFWGFMIAAITFGGLSFLEPYSPHNLSPKFRSVFERNSPKVMLSNRGLIGVCVMWLVLFIPWGYMKLSGTHSAFPFLGGSFSWFTDIFFLVAAFLVFGLSIYLMTRLVKFLRRSNYDKVTEEVENQRINQG